MLGATIFTEPDDNNSLERPDNVCRGLQQWRQGLILRGKCEEFYLGRWWVQAPASQTQAATCSDTQKSCPEHIDPDSEGGSGGRRVAIVTGARISAAVAQLHRIHHAPALRGYKLKAQAKAILNRDTAIAKLPAHAPGE